jgi:hypothetical protein
MDAGASLPTGTGTRLSIARLVRSRLVIGALGLGVIAAALAWQWSWLVAIGVAPLLLSLAPCAAMCGLGLCMRRMGGGSCSTEATQMPSMQSDPRRIGNSTITEINHGDMT